MPRRIKTLRRTTRSRQKKARRTRQWKKRSYFRRGFGALGRYRNPFTASKVNTYLLYNENITLDPQAENLGAGGTNTYVFSMNSLWDPDTTGVGHQPMYFDNYAALFSRYRVNYAQVTVTVINTNVNTATANSTGTVTQQPNYAYKLAIITDRGSSDWPGKMNQLIEEGGPNIKWRYVAPALTGKLPKLFHSGSPHKLTGLGFTDADLSAAVTASPATQAYFAIAITSADGVTNPPSMYLNVRIKYFVEFSDRVVTQPEN